MLNTSNDQRKLLPNFEQLFATTAQAPGGVARLRELILTLAVQGGLVSDELHKIEKLKNIGDWAIGSGFPKDLQGDLTSEIPFVKVSDMNLEGNEIYIEKANNYISKEVAKKYKIKVHPAGTVIFPKIGGAIATNKRRIIKIPTAIDNNCLGITPNQSITKDYLYISLQSIDMAKYQAGTSVPALSQAVLGEIEISLPPIETQSRIVTRVEALMRLCDALEEKGRLAHTQHQQLLQAMLDSLTQTTDARDLARHWQRLAQHFVLLIDRPESVDALEQTILQLAVRGLLVEQKENEDPLQISSSNEALSTHNLNGPFGINIPKGWRIYSLLELGKISGGKTPSTQNNNYWDGDVPWITPKDMKFEILEGSLDKVTKEALKDGLTLYPADSVLMVVRSGILRRIFPVALSKVDFTVNQDLKVLVPDLKISEYLVLMLKGFEREILRDLTKIGTTVESIQFDKFSKFQFPIPPLAEQSRIVARVTELRALCQQLREKLTQARTTQTQLAQSWVEQAAG